MTEKLKLKNTRSASRNRDGSIAEHILMLYRTNPHYPDFEDDVELRLNK